MKKSRFSLDRAIDEHAYRCFRDIADQDYILARISYRLNFPTNFNWLCLQSIEKYLKCILLLNRIPTKGIGHDLIECLNNIQTIKLKTNKTDSIKFLDDSIDFIKQINTRGQPQCRYLGKSSFFKDDELHLLDNCIFDIRRYTIKNVTQEYLQTIKEGILNSIQDFPVTDGYLEKIISSESPAKKDLMWNNGMYGKKNGEWRMAAQNIPPCYMGMSDEDHLELFTILNKLIKVDDFANIKMKLEKAITKC